MHGPGWPAVNRQLENNTKRATPTDQVAEGRTTLTERDSLYALYTKVWYLSSGGEQGRNGNGSQELATSYR